MRGGRSSAPRPPTRRSRRGRTGGRGSAATCGTTDASSGEMLDAARPPPRSAARVRRRRGGSRRRARRSPGRARRRRSARSRPRSRMAGGAARARGHAFKSAAGTADESTMRRLAVIALCLLALPSTATAADRSWAEPQIETVVEAGLLADSARVLQAAEAPDPARARRSARVPLTRLVGARRLPLPDRRAGTRRHDPRARRRACRLPRPRRLRAPRHRRTSRRGPRAEGRRRHRDRRSPARAPLQPPCRGGGARARPERRRDAGGGRLLARAPARPVGLGAGADPVGGCRSSSSPR